MASIPAYAEPATLDDVPAETVSEVSAGLKPRSKKGYAAVSGDATGAVLTYTDAQALAVYKGGTARPTFNRGQRGLTRTERDAGSTGRPGGLWRT